MSINPTQLRTEAAAPLALVLEGYILLRFTAKLPSSQLVSAGMGLLF